MKPSLLTILFCSITGYAFAQITFNKRLSFDRPSAVLNGVVVDSNGYTAVGIITLDSFPYTVGNVFAKFDLEGNLLSNNFLEASGKTYEIWRGGLQAEEGHSILPAIGGGYLIGGRKDNLHLVDIDNRLRTYLVKIDSLGNQQWTWTSLLHRREQGVAGMAATPDSGLLIASALGTEVTNGGSTEIFWDCYIFKLDNQQQFVWGTYFREWEGNEQNRFYDMIEVSNGSGYVAVGEQAIVYEEVSEEENLFDIGGYIVKVSPEGDSLWSRLIIYPDLASFQDWHYFRDIKETPDGGFIMVGKARDFQQSPQGQQAWLVKTDEYGCVVPGCHLSTATDDINTQVLALKLYPNPASEILNVFVRVDDFPKGLELQIINTTGQIQYTQRLAINEATYVLPIHSLISGMYWIRVLGDDGRIWTSEAFIKQ